MQAQISIAAIRRDGGTQIRTSINDDVVEQYVEDIDELPPVVVYYDGIDRWLADGFHRVAAHERAGKLLIKAEVRAGTRREAVLAAVSANRGAGFGLIRTSADKRRAVETLLRDEEWSTWSDREIARRAGVGHSFVSVVRGELSTADSSKEKPMITETPSPVTAAAGPSPPAAPSSPPPISTPAYTRGADGKRRPSKRPPKENNVKFTDETASVSLPDTPAAPSPTGAPGRRRSLSPKDEARARAWRKRGGNNGDIAAKLGVSESTISHLFSDPNSNRVVVNESQARISKNFVTHMEGMAMETARLIPELMRPPIREAFLAAWEALARKMREIKKELTDEAY